MIYYKILKIRPELRQNRGQPAKTKSGCYVLSFPPDCWLEAHEIATAGFPRLRFFGLPSPLSWSKTLPLEKPTYYYKLMQYERKL